MAKRTQTQKRPVVSARTRTAGDWEEAALNAIATHGLRSVAIPDLARALGVTKGSFYWHFNGIEALLSAALRRWEELDRATLEEVHAIGDPRARLEALFEQAMEKRHAHALYVALASSAVAEVTATIRRISDRRLRFLVEAYVELGMETPLAHQQALLAYTAYVGALHLRQQQSSALRREKELREYVAHAVATLIPPSKRRPRKR
jgi:AcrR family transcriptional regulator